MYISDALHLGYYKSMHHFPLVARHLDLHPPHLPRRRRYTHSWLRGCAGGEQEIRVQQRGICEQFAK